MPEPTTPLGDLLEAARKDRTMSIREAARRAGVSDAHWRQVVRGYQMRDGEREVVRPTWRNTVLMATAVGVDPLDALEAAGYERSQRLADEAVSRAIHPANPAPPLDVAAEIERIKALPIAVSERWAAIRALLDMVAETNAQAPELDEERPAG